MSYPAEIPLVTSRTVPFPGAHYKLQGSGSSNLAEISKAQPKYVVLVPFKESEGDDLFEVGVIARVLQINITRRKVSLTVRGSVRAKINAVMPEGPAAFKKGRCEAVPDDEELSKADTATLRKFLSDYLPAARMLEVMPAGAMIDALASALPTRKDQLAILGAFKVMDRLKQASAALGRSENELMPSRSRGANNTSVAGSELEKIKARLMAAEIPAGEARDAIMADLEKAQRMGKTSSDYQVVLSYLDFCAKLPWTVSTEDSLSLAAAQQQLDDDHYGLAKVKRRILEHLAVLKLQGAVKSSPILCFIGPPGTGKSSLGKSIATAMGRKFHRIALGGVRDEAVIRGHRRTYVGALPGRIMEAMKKVGSNNPVILLDEIDKLVQDRGDPSAALLEVLDPVQNNAFTDHYMGVPFDLSNVLFIATGNSSNFPAALKDRMELIEVPGYSFEEKIHIARNNLLPKQLKAHGMAAGSVVITDEALLELARSYTRESGVRNLEREIAAIVRWIVASVVRDGEAAEEAMESLNKVVTTVDASQLEDILGPCKYEERRREHLRLGVSIGLGYTGTGSGSILYIEAAQMPGKGKVQITGSLGDVMKESVNTALSWIRSNNLATGILEETDLHIHFPAGATPKDGPSAGVAITVALVSLLTRRLVRPDVAMTGEISLSGLVLPVGGIKEKTLAAHRNGLRRIYLPAHNMKDLRDVPDSVKKDLTFVPVEAVEEVLDTVFEEARKVQSKL